MVKLDAFDWIMIGLLVFAVVVNLVIMRQPLSVEILLLLLITISCVVLLKVAAETNKKIDIVNKISELEEKLEVIEMGRKKGGKNKVKKSDALSTKSNIVDKVKEDDQEIGTQTGEEDKDVVPDLDEDEA